MPGITARLVRDVNILPEIVKEILVKRDGGYFLPTSSGTGYNIFFSKRFLYQPLRVPLIIIPLASLNEELEVWHESLIFKLRKTAFLANLVVF